MDENRNVPALTGENAGLAAEAAEQARENAVHAASVADQEMDVNLDGSYVTMAVVDGIVISPLVYNFIFQLISLTDLCLALCL